MTASNGSAAKAVLLPRHREQLLASGITEDVWMERGVFSVENKRDLEQLGFGPSGRIAPTLVFPIYGVIPGEPPWYIHRADTPRIKDGRPRKYEIPYGRRVSLDVHPRVQAGLRNPAVPLFTTEGSKKVDALVSAGAQAVVGIVGVWNWRGRNDDDGLTALGDWESVALKEGRQVYVVFDSDWTTNDGVRLAQERLGAFLKHRGARVSYVYLPAGEGGVKVGVDDYLAAGHTLADVVALASSELRKLPSAPDDDTPEPRALVLEPPPLAHDPDILARLSAELHAGGHVGEEVTTKLLYLAVTSRLFKMPISAAVKGASSAGKSASVKRVLEFFPAEAFHVVTSMSPLALAYGKEPLVHRALVVIEAAGVDDEQGAYMLRTLLSEGYLRHEVTEKTAEGQFEVRLVVREGPTGLITTTTAVSLHAENETRMMSLPINDSREQTTAVMVAIATKDRPETDMTEWHALQLWLTDGGRDVDVPYSVYLAENIAPVALRLRRDITALLNLIETHALLHRATRDVDERGRVVATVEDYAQVHALVNDLISEGVSAAVDEKTRAMVAMVNTLSLAGRAHVSTGELAKALEVDKRTAQRRAKVAIDGGYLRNDEDRTNKAYKLTIGDPMPDYVEILPTVASVREWDSGATLARHSPPSRHSGSTEPKNAPRDSATGAQGGYPSTPTPPPLATPEQEALAARWLDEHGDAEPDPPPPEPDPAADEQEALARLRADNADLYDEFAEAS